MIKSYISPEEICSAILKYKKKRKYPHIQYRDGSRIRNLVGFADILPSHTLNGGLPGVASIFIAEMYAVKSATEQLIANNRPASYNNILRLTNQTLVILLW